MNVALFRRAQRQIEKAAEKLGVHVGFLRSLTLGLDSAESIQLL